MSTELSTSEVSSSSSDHALSSFVTMAAVDSTTSSDIFSENSSDFWTVPFLVDSYQNDIASTLADARGLTFPYVSYGDDVVDLFYHVTKEFPEEY